MLSFPVLLLSIFGDSESRCLSNITKWSSCFKSVAMHWGACQKFPDRTSFQSSSNLYYRKQDFEKSNQTFTALRELSEQEQFIHFHFNRTAWFTVFAATFVHKFYLAALGESLKHNKFNTIKISCWEAVSPLPTTKSLAFNTWQRFLLSVVNPLFSSSSERWIKIV